MNPLSARMRAAGRLLGRVCRHNSDNTRAIFRWRQHTPAHPGLEREALHHRGGAEPLRAGRGLSTPRCSEMASSTPRGVFRGSLYLRGGGDPTFGSRRFAHAFLRRGGHGAGSGRDPWTRRGSSASAGGSTATSPPSIRCAAAPTRATASRRGLGPLSAWLLQPRPLHDGTSRGFQANPPAFAAAGLDDALEALGVAVRLRPRAGPTPGGRARARERRVAADGAADPAHQQAVGQLLRRDAAQGPRAPGRRARHHRRAARGIAAALRPRDWARAPTARGRLGARRAATAPPRSASCGCSPAMRRARRLRPVRRLAADRGPRRHALRPHAPRRRRAAAAAARRARSRT